MINRKQLEEAIDEAIYNPKKCYSNILDNDDSGSIFQNEAIPYICVFLFLCENSIQNSEKFKIKYSEEIKKECDNIPKTYEATNYIVRNSRFLRNLIFKEEYKEIVKCKNSVDYNNYLKNYGCRCEEFDLFAHYKIAIENKNQFVHLNTVVKRYFNSDLFNIEELKTKCQDINGFYVLWSDNVTKCQKKEIVQILENMSYVDKVGYYSHYITKRQWHIVTNTLSEDTLNALIPSSQTPMLCSRADYRTFCEYFESITSITLKTINIEELKMVCENELPTKDDIEYEWCLSVGKSGLCAYNHLKEKEYIYVNDVEFATYRLIIKK